MNVDLSSQSINILWLHRHTLCFILNVCHLPESIVHGRYLKWLQPHCDYCIICEHSALSVMVWNWKQFAMHSSIWVIFTTGLSCPLADIQSLLLKIYGHKQANKNASNIYSLCVQCCPTIVWDLIRPTPISAPVYKSCVNATKIHNATMQSCWLRWTLNY